MNKALQVLLVLAIVIAGSAMRPYSPASVDISPASGIETGASDTLKEQAVARYHELTRTHAKRSPFLKPIYYSSMIAWIIIEALAGICFFIAFRHLKKLRREGKL